MNNKGYFSGIGAIIWLAFVLVIVIILFGYLFIGEAQDLKENAYVEDARVDWEAGYLALALLEHEVTMNFGNGGELWKLRDLLVEHPLEDMDQATRQRLQEELDEDTYYIGNVREDDVIAFTPAIVIRQEGAVLCASRLETKFCRAAGTALAGIREHIDSAIVKAEGEIIAPRLATIVIPTQPQTTLTVVMQEMGGKS